ncbi:hypothetical protein ES702_02104 [subsurface metagenome]
MNKQQLINTISREHGYPKAESERILNTILQTIKTELRKGHLVRLRNFGTFQARKSHGKVRAKFDDSKNFFKNP